MRSIHFNLILLVMLFISVSCGGSKSTKANIVVSHGFSISNSGYEGGLVIYGKELSTGESFSYSSLPNSNANKIELDLKKGNWSFGAVGWAGGGSNNNLKGSVYCGLVSTVNLSGSAQTVNLSLSKANCFTSSFSSPLMFTTTAGVDSHKPLKLFACPKINGAANNAGNTFCSDLPSIDESEGDDIWGVKIRLPSKPLPGTTPSGVVESACISASDLGYMNLAAYSIPSKGFPFEIVTYVDKNCSMPSGLYPLPQSFENIPANSFQFALPVLPTQADTPKLFIVSTRSKSQVSPLASLMPELKCSIDGTDHQCVQIKDTDGFDYYIHQPFVGSRHEIIISQKYGCSNFSGFTTTNGLAYGSCENRDKGGATLILNGATGTDCSMTGCTLSYNDLENGPQTKTISVVSGNYSEALRYQEKLLQTVGVSNSSFLSQLVFSLAHLDNIKKSQGMLHDAREMLSAHAIGGAFRDIASCSALTGIRYLDTFDEGTYVHYQVEAFTISESVPRQMCPNGVALDSNHKCPTLFTKKVVLRQPVGPQYKAFQTIKINCTHKVGVLENHHNSPNGNKERRILYWSTDDADSSKTRIQRFSYEEKFNGSGQYERVRTEAQTYNRGTYIAGADSFLINSSEYEYRLNPSAGTYSEKIVRDEIISTISGSTPIATYKKSFENMIAGSAGEAFIMPELASAMKEVSNSQNMTGTDLIKSTSSPNGAYRMIVVFTEGGTGYSYLIQNGSTVKKGTANLPYDYTVADIAINDSGKAVIVYEASGEIKFTSFDATLATPFVGPVSPSPSIAVMNLGKIKLFLGNDNYISMGLHNTSSGRLRYELVNLSGTRHPSVTLPITKFYETTFNISDFVLRHTSGTNGNFCYTSGSYLKCINVAFPTVIITNNNPQFQFSAGAIGLGATPPMLTMSSVATGNIQFYSDPSCSNSITTNTSVDVAISSNIPLNISMSNAPIQLYFTHTNTGAACNNANTSYYQWNPEINIPMVSIGSGSLSISTTETSGNLRLNHIGTSQIKSYEFDGGTITSPATSGTMVMASSSQLSIDKTGSVVTGIISNPINIDDESTDTPVPSVYDGSLLGLKPQTFIGVFTSSSVFQGQ